MTSGARTGFNATLEDWGRFGEFVARDGRLSNGKQLVPAGWFDQAASWTKALNSVSAAHPQGIYGYQWWNNAIPANAQHVQPTPQEGLQGSLWALGIDGQVIMVNRAEHLVIVQWSTWPQAEPSFNAQPLESGADVQRHCPRIALISPAPCRSAGEERIGHSAPDAATALSFSHR